MSPLSRSTQPKGASRKGRLALRKVTTKVSRTFPTASPLDLKRPLHQPAHSSVTGERIALTCVLVRKPPSLSSTAPIHPWTVIETAFRVSGSGANGAHDLTNRSSRDRFAARLARYRVPLRRAAARPGLTQVLGAFRNGIDQHASTSNRRDCSNPNICSCCSSDALAHQAILSCFNHQRSLLSGRLFHRLNSASWHPGSTRANCARLLLWLRVSYCTSYRGSCQTHNPLTANTRLTIRSSRHRFVASALRLRYATLAQSFRHCAARLNSGVRPFLSIRNLHS